MYSIWDLLSLQLNLDYYVFNPLIFEFAYPLWNIYTLNPFLFEIHILHEKEFCNLLYDLQTSTILILVDLFNGEKSFLSLLRWEVPYLLPSLSLFNIPSLILFFFFKVRKP